MADQVAKWQNVKLQWPSNSTAWLNDLAPVNQLIQDQQAQTALNIAALEQLISYQPSPLAESATEAATKAQAALTDQFSNAPYCLAVTPFQPGVSEGKGVERYLSAPNLINHLVNKLNDNSDANRPSGNKLSAIVVLFLSLRYRDFSHLLAGFNSLLNIEDLEKAERRALYLADLEKNRQIMPKAGTLPKWQKLNLAKTNLISQLKNSLTAQVASLESYTTNDPIDSLKSLLAFKEQQSKDNDQTIDDLKDLLANQGETAAIRCSYLVGGNTTDIKKQLLALEDTPSYDWVLCAGVMFIGEEQSLSFIKEVVGL